MSGHSKWATIKRKKAATDAKKGQLFSKLSKLIELAAKKGADPRINFSLKAVMDQARAVNLPLDNIERAIKKGSGKLAGGASLAEALYGAYGPGGAAILITAVTSNKNKTVAEIKHILGQNEASLSGADSVKWLFEPKYEDGNMIWSPKQTIKLSDEAEAKLMALLSDLDDQEDVTAVYTNAE